MRKILIKHQKEFVDFCKRNYDNAKNSDFRERFLVVLSPKFDEFKDLNNYIVRFLNYRNDRDPDGEYHRKFLDNINFGIKIILNNENKKADNFINNLEKFFCDLEFELCKWTVKIEVNLANKPFDFALLSNALLLCAKLLNMHQNISFEVDLNNVHDGDYWDISTYVSWLNSKYDNLIIKCKDNKTYKKVSSKVEFYGSLPPAIFITQENLHLLQQPLSGKLWQSVKEKKFDYSDLFEYKAIEPYLKICQIYLFEEFKGNESASYTELRRTAYNSAEFAGYVKTIPFLALLLFAMYDNSYRSDLLSDAKGDEYYNRILLDKADFLLEMQGEQDYRRYERYLKKRKVIDVKNLLDHADSADQKTKLHSTIISEIFECVSIAEGLLQILENAALHAGGGLLSMRIYSRVKQLTTKKYKKQEHADYLDREYSADYFNLNGLSGTNYFLEVQISDFSEQSIPEKFISNYTDDKYVREAKDNKEKEEREAIKTLIAEKRDLIDLNYFFGLDQEPDRKVDQAQKNVKNKFFNLSNKNFVFHYGLEIFKTLVTARKGIFAVCGYNQKYNNFGNNIFPEIKTNEQKVIDELEKLFPKTFKELQMKEKIEPNSGNKLNDEMENKKNSVISNITRNIAIDGTTYRMLLPLNHNVSYNSIAVSGEVEISIDDEIASKFTDVRTVNIAECSKKLNTGSSIEEKRKRIENISAIIKSCFGSESSQSYTSKKLLCLNFNNDETIRFFEEAIKGCVLFVLSKLSKKYNYDYDLLPVALVNLTSFQLIEAARILAIFYSNNEVAQNDNFKNFQFYLKSTDGKDLLFAGHKISEVKEKLLKTAMANGAMNKDLTVIEQLLGRME